jgi:predicted DCC family thiol-disulfide oxidoreductase YuxK
VRHLVLLYDAGCPLCTRFRQWLVDQPHAIPLSAIAAGSPEARRLLPALDHDATLREVTVVGDDGQVWSGARAWVMCLWATVAHRETALRLSTPVGLPVARAMAYAAAGLRGARTTTALPAPGRLAGGGYPDDCDGHCQPV